MAEAKAQYSAILLGATGNVGGRIVQLLIKNPLCKKVVVVTRRKTEAFADPKISEVVVNMGRLEEDVAPHAQEVDVALAAFGVGKGSAKMPEEEVRKIEIAYPQAFCRAATSNQTIPTCVALIPQSKIVLLIAPHLRGSSEKPDGVASTVDSSLILPIRFQLPFPVAGRDPCVPRPDLARPRNPAVCQYSQLPTRQ